MIGREKIKNIDIKRLRESEQQTNRDTKRESERERTIKRERNRERKEKRRVRTTESARDREGETYGGFDRYRVSSTEYRVPSTEYRASLIKSAMPSGINSAFTPLIQIAADYPTFFFDCLLSCNLVTAVLSLQQQQLLPVKLCCSCWCYAAAFADAAAAAATAVTAAAVTCRTTAVPKSTLVGRMAVHTDGRTDGRPDDRTDGQPDGQSDGHLV